MLFLLSFLAAVDIEARGGTASDDAENSLGAAAALSAGSASCVDLTGTARTAPNGLTDLDVADRVAEANVHLSRPYTGR